jgi:hypothetical protein
MPFQPPLLGGDLQFLRLQIPQQPLKRLLIRIVILPPAKIPDVPGTANIRPKHGWFPSPFCQTASYYNETSKISKHDLAGKITLTIGFYACDSFYKDLRSLKSRSTGIRGSNYHYLLAQIGHPFS